MNTNDTLLITVPVELECNFFVDNTVKVETRLRSNEVTFTNNNQTIDVQLYNPDFAAHSLLIPSTQLASGQIFDITYSVTNNGAVDFSDYVNSWPGKC